MKWTNRISPGTARPGWIDKEMLSRYLKDAVSPIYYIAGPPGMVKGLHTMINGTELMMTTSAWKSLTATDQKRRRASRRGTECSSRSTSYNELTNRRLPSLTSTTMDLAALGFYGMGKKGQSAAPRVRSCFRSIATLIAGVFKSVPSSGVDF